MKKDQGGFTAVFWLLIILFLFIIGATGFMAWYNRMNEEKGPGWFAVWLENWVNQPTPSPAFTGPSLQPEPTVEESNRPTAQQENLVLSVTFKPEVIREGEKQKLTFQIKNETQWVLIIKEAKIDWYYNPGQGFYLAEQQPLAGSDLRWLATKVPAGLTKTVYQETTTGSGRGQWRGEITVVTNLKNLTAQVTHTIQ